MIITSNSNKISYSRTFFTKKFISLYLILLGLLLSSCTHTINLNVSNGMVLPAQTPIVVGPFANHSDTPLANRQVESMVVGLLRTRGFTNVIAYPRPQSCDKLVFCPDDAVSTANMVAWTRRHGAAYLLTGAANEWRYKVGLDGEPVAGVSLSLVNVTTGKTDWSAVGSISGAPRSGLDVVGQQLLATLLLNFIAVG